MKKRIISIWGLCILCLLVFAACNNETPGTQPTTTVTAPDYGSLSVKDITIMDGEAAQIEATFSKEGVSEPITYEFEGNAISIDNGIVTAYVGDSKTVVKAKTAHHETVFTVTVQTDYGTLSIADAEVTFSLETPVIPVFSRENRAEEITYSFEGSNIAIEKGVITGLVPGTQTLVTAKTAHHEATFTVKVNYLDGVLTKPNGIEAKLSLVTPANTDRYVSFTTVDVEKWRENGFTRISSFAFNASNNSWYNMEMNEAGQVYLYGRFNGVEKYSIYLFHKNDPGIMVDGKIHYTVAIYRNGQRTVLFVNDQLVCYFTEREMEGYATLGNLEVTAAADRANAGEYRVALSRHYYSTDSAVCDEYEARYEDALSVPVKLKNDKGDEAKHIYSDVDASADFVYTAKVSVNTYVEGWTRTSAFAFNGSDNSWYNIETDASGNFHLFARFNNVEKYWIYLFNKNDEGIMVDGKVQYTVTILKQGQATWFFVNDKLVCSFNAQEMTGYYNLETLEVTACANRIPGAYDVDILAARIQDEESEDYAKYMALTNP